MAQQIGPRPNFVECSRVADVPIGRVAFASIRRTCGKCHAPIWIAPSTLLEFSSRPELRARVLCRQCSLDWQIFWLQKNAPAMIRRMSRQEREKLLETLEAMIERRKGMGK